MTERAKAKMAIPNCLGLDVLFVVYRPLFRTSWETYRGAGGASGHVPRIQG